MKKTLVALAIVGSFISVANANDNSSLQGVYLGGQLGGSWLKAGSIDHQFADGVDPANLSFDSQSKSVLAGGLSVGYNFKPQFDLPIRTELAFTIRGSLNKNTNAQSISYEDDNNPGTYLNDDYYLNVKTHMNTLMINTYYDIDTGTNFTPYVSLGIGAAFLKYERTGLVMDSDNSDADTNSKSKTRFAYAAGLGGTYKITDNWSADIIVQYTYGGKVSVSTFDNSAESTQKLSTTDLMVGVRYTF